MNFFKKEKTLEDDLKKAKIMNFFKSQEKIVDNPHVNRAQQWRFGKKA